MACTSACFDCPFLKIADKVILTDDQLEDYVIRHFTLDGGFEEIQCEEQGDICFGQIQMLANSHAFGLDPWGDLGEAVEATKPNHEDFFSGPWQFLPHHRP